MAKNISHILISRTDSIGDVVLTLPMAKFLKEYLPGVKISFLGKSYTRPVIEACVHVDEFIDKDDFFNTKNYFKIQGPDTIIHVFPVKAIAIRAKQLHVPHRIGTTNRIYHWLTCNKLVKLSRKNTFLHEAQLNLKLLKGFDIDHEFSLKEIEDSFGLSKTQPLQTKFASLLNKEKFNLVIHPKSQGSSREWGHENFITLIKSLDKERYEIFISGTAKERELMQQIFDEAGGNVTDITGIMDLGQFISFIEQCDGLVANSTGPLHIAAALGKYAFGIFPPLWPMNPKRWAPLGKNAASFVIEKNCEACRNNSIACSCIKEVNPFWIKAELDKACDSIFNEKKIIKNN